MQDQPTQNKAQNQTQGTSTKNLIRQSGSEVQIGNFNESDATINHTINCQSPKAARQLALELSGTKALSADQGEITYKKLRSHPWYGTVLLEELTEGDRQFIAIFVRENSNYSTQDFKLKAHSLFIDEPHKPINHALIQEILQVIANSGDHNE